MFRKVALPMSWTLSHAACACAFFVRAPLDAAADEQSDFEMKFKFPAAKALANKGSNIVHTLKMTTNHDVDAVAKHYETVIGMKMTRFTEPIVRFSDDGVAMAFDDSTGPGDDKRPSTLRMLLQETKTYCLTLVISRAEQEELNHIVVLMIRKAGETSK